MMQRYSRRRNHVHLAFFLVLSVSIIARSNSSFVSSAAAVVEEEQNGEGDNNNSGSAKTKKEKDLDLAAVAKQCKKDEKEEEGQQPQILEDESDSDSCIDDGSDTRDDNNDNSNVVFDMFGKWADDMKERGQKFFKDVIFTPSQIVSTTTTTTTREEKEEEELQHEEGGNEIMDMPPLQVEEEDSSDDGQETWTSNKKEQEQEENANLGGPMEGLMDIFNVISGGASYSSSDQSSSETRAVDELMERARNYNMAKEDRGSDGDTTTVLSKETRSLFDVFDLFRSAITDVTESMNRNFRHVDLSKFKLPSLFYFLELEDATKNPSWKRRMHRFHPSIDPSQLLLWHDLLFLSDLSYVDTMEKIRVGVRNATEEVEYELIYCKMDSGPSEPAHYIALPKGQGGKVRSSKPWRWSGFPWVNDDEDALEVLLVVRGTKELGDLLSDALLDAVDYRGGKAHAGIVAAGKYLVEKHQKLFNDLLSMSNKTKIDLTILGHSLGAGAAAIAAMEFNNEVPTVDASVIGFGCPSLLSKELSESTKEYITTVVSDSDVVPRMSGATVANAVLDVMSYDWSDSALRDVTQLLNVWKENWPLGEIPQSRIDQVIEFVDANLNDTVKKPAATIPKERVDPVLIPPGTCVHLYRDGVGVSGTYTPCDFFNQLDITRTMLYDHLVGPGYHRMFLDLMRTIRDDLDFSFRHVRMPTMGI